MRVAVYYNLHKSCWSVRALEGPDKGRIVAHEPRLTLTNCKMAVQPGGNAKVRREGRKTVHAFIRGDWTGADLFDSGAWERITYNPYKNTSFVSVADGREVSEAAVCVFTDERPFWGYDVV